MLFSIVAAPFPSAVHRAPLLHIFADTCCYLFLILLTACIASCGTFFTVKNKHQHIITKESL